MIFEFLYKKNIKLVRQLDIVKFEFFFGYGDSDWWVVWWFVLLFYFGGQEECEVCYQLFFEQVMYCF